MPRKSLLPDCQAGVFDPSEPPEHAGVACMGVSEVSETPRL